MYKNDLIYMTTTTSSSVLQNGIIPLTTITRRRGCAIQSSSNGISLLKPGYYKVNGTVTFNVPAIGDVSIQVYKNGVAVTGLESTTTMSVADTQTRTLAISGIVRVFCNEGQSVLTLVNTGVAITTTNVSLDVEYLG